MRSAASTPTARGACAIACREGASCRTQNRLLGEGRIRDWLRLLGFEVTLSQRFLFVAPWRMSGGADPGSWLERRGPELFAPLSGAYLVKARKRVRALTPIRPVWQRARTVAVGAAEPTTRNAA